MQHELQSSGAEWAYKNVYVKPLMKGPEYNYQPEILNSFHAIKTLQSEFCVLEGRSFNELIQFRKKNWDCFSKVDWILC